MYYHSFNSSFGEIIILGDENGITNIKIADKDLDDKHELNKTIFKEAEKQIIEYLKGSRKNFNLKLNLKGTDFQLKVWRELQNIPYGEVCCYKEIAEKIGNPKASRAIGMANNKNPIPILIPCHRVIGKNGKLTGYAFGIDMKKKLLELEKRGR